MLYILHEITINRRGPSEIHQRKRNDGLGEQKCQLKVNYVKRNVFLYGY